MNRQLPTTGMILLMLSLCPPLQADETGQAAETATIDGKAADGKAAFDTHCALCHREGGTGTYMLARRPELPTPLLEERRSLSPDYVRTVVRWGVGSMPRFTRTELNDTALQAIAGYLAENADSNPQPAP